MALQSIVTDSPAKAIAGTTLRSPTEKVVSRPAGATVAPGRFVMLQPDNTLEHPAAVAADADALVASGVVANDQGDDLEVDVKLQIARNVTVTFAAASQANIAATDATIKGFLNGVPVSETFTLTANNAAASNHVGTQLFDEVTTIEFAAQDGDVTAEVGLGTLLGDADVYGLAVLSSHRVDTDYAQHEQVPALRKGEMYVECEDACTEGEQVYVRVVAGAGESLGAVRATPDGSASAPDAARAKGWKFAEDGAAGALVRVEKL